LQSSLDGIAQRLNLKSQEIANSLQEISSRELHHIPEVPIEPSLGSADDVLSPESDEVMRSALVFEPSERALDSLLEKTENDMVCMQTELQTRENDLAENSAEIVELRGAILRLEGMIDLFARDRIDGYIELERFRTAKDAEIKTLCADFRAQQRRLIEESHRVVEALFSQLRNSKDLSINLLKMIRDKGIPNQTV
jgi:hypothetical protein